MASKQGALSEEQVGQGLAIQEAISRFPARLEQVLAFTSALRAGLAAEVQTKVQSEQAKGASAEDSAKRKEDEMTKGMAALDQVDTAFREFANTGRYRKKLCLLGLPRVETATSTADPNRKSSTAASPSAQTLCAEGLAGVEGLHQAMALVDRELERVGSLTLATFDAYTHSQQLEPEILMLRFSVLSQVAETWHRLGRHRIARDLWRRTLTLDPLCLPALKNIAVSDTLAAGDHARVLQSWKAYCEVLYYHAIAGGSARLSARLRAEFHSLYASAFAYGYVQEDRESASRDDDRARKFLRLLNSPGSLREYVQHRCAELLNRRFEIRTPTLFLGASRTAKPEVREKQRNALVGFVQMVCANLPERVRTGYEKVCLAEIDRALEECRKPEGLTLASNPRYAEDEQKLIHWMASVYRIREQFFYGFMCLPDPATKGHDRIKWEEHVRQLDFLEILDGLTAIPLGSSDDFKEAAVSAFAKTYRTSQPHIMVRKLDGFVAGAGALLSAHVYHNPTDRLLDLLMADLKSRKTWWQWAQRNVTEELSKVFVALDQGGFIFSDELKKIFNKEERTQSDFERAAVLLTPLCKRCPALAGMAAHLAGILASLSRTPEAIRVLDEAIANGFYPPSVEECRRLRNKISGTAELAADMEKQDYPQAVKRIVKELDQTPQEFALVESLLGVYQKWCQEKPDQLALQVGTVDKQLTRILESAFPDEASRSGEAANDYVRLLRSKRDLVAVVARGKAGDFSDSAEREQATSRLEEIRSRDAGNITVIFMLAVAYFKAGVAKFKETIDDKGKADFVKADAFATHVIQAEVDSNIQKQASQIREQIARLQAAL